MAFNLDISQAAYSKIERDETEMSLRRIYEIAEILEISPFALMPPPKYGTGINYQSIMRTLSKLKKFWSFDVRRRKASAASISISLSDKSNNKN
jgi:transcriptional regulator with XRE-family HTH domain